MFDRSLWCLQAGRTQPIADMAGRLGLPGPPKKQLPRRAARRFSFGRFLESSGLCRQSFFKTQFVFDSRAQLDHRQPLSAWAPQHFF